MKIRIEPYRQEMVEAVRDFNRRVASAPRSHSITLPESPDPGLLPMGAGDGFGQECFIALEGSAVRGGYILYRQRWFISGEAIAVGNCMRPISEGVTDASYGLVGIRLLRDALEREPLMFGLGLGPDGAMTKILKAQDWEIWQVPFYFKILNGARFVRNFQPLRGTRARSVLMDLIATSGLASLGARLARGCASRTPATWTRPRLVPAEEIGHFSSWADEVWDRSRRAYSVLEMRDSAILNRLFSGRDEFIRLKVAGRNGPAGWAVLDPVSSNQARFGNMNVWSILDCLAPPEEAPAVIHAAASYLENKGVDLIISNQSHPAWQKALRSAGFCSGPSTFLFASVPSLTKILHAADPLRQRMHFTRGGGDVPLVWHTGDHPGTPRHDRAKRRSSEWLPATT